jgi:MFS family permease
VPDITANDLARYDASGVAMHRRSRRIYGFEVLVLAAGAIASAFSPDIWWLIGFRIVLGIGIGGDYPVSSTVMSEYAGT